jgi:hypothetical protein
MRLPPKEGQHEQNWTPTIFSPNALVMLLVLSFGAVLLIDPLLLVAWF